MLIYETKKEHNALNICIDESNPATTPDVVITKDASGKTNIRIDGSSSDTVWEPSEGEHSAQLVGSGSVASGAYSTAEGQATLAESDYSHTEGWVTRAVIDDTDPDSRGHAAHAEGSHTVAKGACSHAEGNSTESHGWYSHAEGAGSLAGGIASHAEGNGTVTNNFAEHAEGSFNMSNVPESGETDPTAKSTLHSIGIGTSLQDKKNAFEIMQNGDIYVLGLGGYDGTNISEAQTLQDVIKSLLPHSDTL